MSERVAEVAGDDGRGTEWDEVADYEEMRAVETAQNIEEIKSLSKEYGELERDFAGGLAEASQKYADDRERRDAYMDFYVKKYESRLRHNRSLAESNIKNAGITNPYFLATCENIVMDDPEKSIEVASARFYDDRLRALLAVAAPEEAQMLDEAVEKALDHVYYDYMPKERTDETYNARRTAAHDRMIEHLNAMNNLATAHGLTPFTARNFSSSAGYHERQDPHYGYLMRLRSDRTLVERYFDVALKNDIEPLRRRLERETRY